MVGLKYTCFLELDLFFNVTFHTGSTASRHVAIYLFYAYRFVNLLY